MKIKAIRSQIIRLPVDEPLADGPPSGRAYNMFVTIRIDTDDGIEGIGAAFFGGALSGTLKYAIDELGAMIVGDDPLRIEAVTQKLRNAGASAGPGGILTLAIAGIDMALWDIKGKFLGQSLSTMLGGVRERVPTYASGALVRSYSLDHLLKSCRTLVERGFKQMKTQMALPGDITPAQGSRTRAPDARSRRALIVDLMCDINQRWSVNQAIDIGKRVEDVHFFLARRRDRA
jgi:L-alanine-DL-glutamate epimerase-like enolase superfamily enzyme